MVEIAQMIGNKIINKRQFGGICRVEFVVGQADAQCVVVQMLFVRVDVGIVDEGFAEGFVQIGRDGSHFCVASLFCQPMCIVCQIDKGIHVG